MYRLSVRTLDCRSRERGSIPRMPAILHIFEKHLGPVGVVRQVREVRLGYPPPISVILTRQL